MFAKIILIGNLGRDPEMRYTPAGQAVANFTMATNRRWNDGNGEKREETTWFRITAWGRQAEVVTQYLSKGRRVMVEGRLNPDPSGNPRIWTGQDGQARANFEVTAERVIFLDSGNGNGGVPEAQGEHEAEAEEIPF